MLDRITDRIKMAMRLSDTDAALFRYGLEAVVCDGTDFLAVLILSVFFHNTAETTVYIVLFGILRGHCGGYHAKTKTGCLLLYVSIYLAYVLCVTLIDQGLLYMAVWILSSAYACINAPAEHVFNPLSEEEHAHHHMMAVGISVIYALLLVLTYTAGSHLYKTIAFISFANACSMEALKHTKEWRRI